MNQTRFHLRCKFQDLSKFANRYGDVAADEEVMHLKDAIQGRGHMLTAELRTLAQWKSPRSAGQIERNSPEFVEEVTQAALSAKEERFRIESLTLLDGVGWPTASCILHFYHKDFYPIIDFRALWTLSMPQPSDYKFEYWISYLQACRKLSEKSGLSMRMLDRALWQYSKENQ